VNEMRLDAPVSESAVRALKIGDIVHVSGVAHTMRDMGHRRLIEMIKRGEKPPFDLSGGVVFHCGPIVRKHEDGWEIVAAGPTSSSRFTELGAEVVERLRVRLTIGKGFMGRPMIDALKKVGGVFLAATGGCAALYSKQVANVEGVHWLDLGSPEAIWVLRLNELGPLVVGIDAAGNTLQRRVLENARERVKEVYKEQNIDPQRTYVWWPKQIAGTKELMDSIFDS
jgi:fumarate hydratase subunit beta